MIYIYLKLTNIYLKIDKNLINNIFLTWNFCDFYYAKNKNVFFDRVDLSIPDFHTILLLLPHGFSPPFVPFSGRRPSSRCAPGDDRVSISFGSMWPYVKFLYGLDPKFTRHSDGDIAAGHNRRS